MEDEKEIIPFTIILHAGNAKSNAMEALYMSREGNFDDAERMIEEAKSDLIEAHRCQTQILQSEAGGKKQEINILLCHSMDHIVMATNTLEMAEEIIMLRKQIKTLYK